MNVENTVYTLVNGRIRHKNRKYQKKRWHYSAVHWHFGNVMLRNITFFSDFVNITW